MKVLNLSIFDYAGAGHKYSQAVNRVGKYHSKSVKVYPHRFGYKSNYTMWNSRNPNNALLLNPPSFIQDLIDDADIIHLVGAESVLHWNSEAKWKSAYSDERYPGLLIPIDKPIVITALGRLFRRHLVDPKYKNINRGRDPISVVATHTNARTVDTPDLNYPEFDAEWLPLAHDTKSIKNLWLSNSHDIPLIGHSPSSRLTKGTNSVFIPALEILKTRGFKFEVDVIEDVSHQECVERKKKLTLFFDQVGIGWYANSLIEACQYGVPSMAWLDDFPFSQMEEKDKKVEVISFNKSPEALADAIIAFFESDMAEASRRTKAWVDATHSYEAVGARLSDIYDRIV